MCRGVCSDLCVTCSQCCSCSCRCSPSLLHHLTIVHFYLNQYLGDCSRSLRHLCCEYKMCNYGQCPDQCSPVCAPDQETSCDQYQCVSCQCSGADQDCGAAQCCCLFVRYQSGSSHILYLKKFSFSIRGIKRDKPRELLA